MSIHNFAITLLWITILHIDKKYVHTLRFTNLLVLLLLTLLKVLFKNVLSNNIALLRKTKQGVNQFSDTVSFKIFH